VLDPHRHLGVALVLDQWFGEQLQFVSGWCFSPSCVEKRAWSETVAHGTWLAVICVIFAFFRVVRPIPLLVVAIAAFGFAAV